MRDTVVVSDDYAYGKPPSGNSLVRTLLCGVPLFSDTRRRPPTRMKSTQFCSYTALPTCFKQNEMETAHQLSGESNSIHRKHPSVSIAKFQNGCSSSSVNSTSLYSEQKRSASMFEMDHRPKMGNILYDADEVQQYYEKLLCQLTMSNSALMRENQRHQLRFKHLRMLLENHIDHLNNIYFTLFLHGFDAVQFPDDHFRRPVGAISDNGSFADISGMTLSEEDTESEPIIDVSRNEAGESSRSIMSSSDDDDIVGYLQWLNGQTTVR